MTPLQQRMIEDLQLRGLSERTQEMYVRAVRQLAEHSHTSPARITEEELRDYFFSLKNGKHYSRRASTIALCGSTCFYAHTLQRDWTPLTFVRPPQEHTLPGHPQPGGRPHHPPACAVAALSRLPAHHLCLWPALARGHPPADSR